MKMIVLNNGVVYCLYWHSSHRANSEEDDVTGNRRLELILPTALLEAMNREIKGISRALELKGCHAPCLS